MYAITLIYGKLFAEGACVHISSNFNYEKQQVLTL